MKTAVGIINLHGAPSLGKLTERRPIGAVTFLGRYGLIDFALSNFTNSGINKIEILVEHGLDSMRSHTSNGSIWVSNTKTGFLRCVINEKAMFDKEENTDISNIVENIPLDILSEDYVVIAPAHFLTSLDFQDVFLLASENNAGITNVYIHTKEPKNYIGCTKVIVSPEGEIIRTTKVDGTEDECDVSLDTYVISSSVFIGMIHFAREISNTRATLNKVVDIYTKNRMTKVCGYNHKGYVVPILNLNQYCFESFKLLEHKNRLKLFSDDWTIYTTTHNTPPVLYGDKSDVENSFIANGCSINGKVKNSIICRDVTIAQGAVVENCILFSKTEVGNGVKLNHVVTDKDVHIKNVKNLSGDEPDYLLISRGASI